jgi:hypothetical protein
MGTDKGLDSTIHRLEIKQLAEMPDPMRLQRIRRGAFVDEVPIGAPHRREASVEVFGCDRHGVDRDLRGEHGAQRPNHRGEVEACGIGERGDLMAGVDPGIGPPGYREGHLMTQDRRQRRLDLPLDGANAGVARPPAEPGSVV